MEYKKWKAINTQADIDELLEIYGGFHDSCIVSITYEVNEEKAMVFGESKDFNLNVIFHSQWEPKDIELSFKGLRRLNLTGLQDNYDDSIYDAALFFCDDILPSKYNASKRTIVWANDAEFDITKINNQLTEPADTYIIAQALLWRVL